MIFGDDIYKQYSLFYKIFPMILYKIYIGYIMGLIFNIL